MGAVLLALTRGSEPNRDISEAISTDGCLQVYANKVHTESGNPINTTCLPLARTHTYTHTPSPFLKPPAEEQDCTSLFLIN